MMKNEKPSLVFFGNERLATGVTTDAPTLRALIEAGYKVVAVVSHYERGLSRSARRLEIQDVAEKYGIPVLLPGRPEDILDELSSYNADIAVLAAYGKIVSEPVIDIFPKGIINIHPSLLPLHRGPTPIESVILSGEEQTGVSIMQLSKAMDAGPVFGFAPYSLDGTETKQTLATTLLELGASLLIDLLPGILDGTVVGSPQDEQKATYDSMIKKEHGIIDWTKAAEQLEREIRAFVEWPKSQTKLGSVDVVITESHATTDNRPDSKPGEIEIVVDAHMIRIECGSGSLWIDRLKPAGKNEMDVAGFLAGYKSRLLDI
jgi:methionyl-tRNA formyltransferase